eukprot:4168112-Amphidinium_carterae.1
MEAHHHSAMPHTSESTIQDNCNVGHFRLLDVAARGKKKSLRRSRGRYELGIVVPQFTIVCISCTPRTLAVGKDTCDQQHET